MNPSKFPNLGVTPCDTRIGGSVTPKKEPSIEGYFCDTCDACDTSFEIFREPIFSLDTGCVVLYLGGTMYSKIMVSRTRTEVASQVSQVSQTKQHQGFA